MMNNLNIRPATQNDLPALLLLEQKVIAAERPFNHSIKRTRTAYYDLNHLVEHHDSCLLVAEINEKLIGSGYAQIRTSKQSLNHDQHAYLGFMYVEAEYRGQGLNKRILDKLITWSKTHKITDFYLDVYEGNDAAIKAYEKVGFKKCLVEMKLNLD